MQTMQQQRAKFALTEVLKAANDLKINNEEYKSHAAALPVMIHMNGLGQAAAFYKSKGDAAHRALYDLLSRWLTGPGQPYENTSDLIHGIVHSDMRTYRLAQAEAVALMDWVKKMAAAHMAGG